MPRFQVNGKGPRLLPSPLTSRHAWDHWRDVAQQPDEAQGLGTHAAQNELQMVPHPVVLVGRILMAAARKEEPARVTLTLDLIQTVMKLTSTP